MARKVRLPTVSVPTPPAPVPLTVSPPSPSSSPSPAAPLPSSSTPATGGSSSSLAELTSQAYSSRSSERPRRPAARSRAARVTGIRARPGRVRHARGQRRRAARITFTLSAPGRVVFVVRGPAPSCSVAGSFSVRGRRQTPDSSSSPSGIVGVGVLVLLALSALGLLLYVIRFLRRPYIT